MINRFRRIYGEFGGIVLARTLLLLAGVIGMAIFGILVIKSPWMLVVAVIGLGGGWLLRRTIVEYFEILSWALPAALFVYGIVLFVGDRILGLSGEMQLLIITITTVLVFDIQFWSFSDTSIVKTDDL